MATLQELSEEHDFSLCELCQDALPVLALAYTGDRYAVELCEHCLLDLVEETDEFMTLDPDEADMKIDDATEKLGPIFKSAYDLCTDLEAHDYDHDDEHEAVLVTVYGDVLEIRDSE